MEKKLKLYTTTIKSIDDENKSIRFRISDDSIDRYGEKVHMPLISAERSLFGRWLPGVNLVDALARQPGLADDLISALEIRAIWGRYGL